MFIDRVSRCIVVRLIYFPFLQQHKIIINIYIYIAALNDYIYFLKRDIKNKNVKDDNDAVT